MTPAEALAWMKQTVTIRRDGGVWFGETQLPGCIAENGIEVKPGGGAGFNRMTVEFLVGDVITEDPTKEQQ